MVRRTALTMLMRATLNLNACQNGSYRVDSPCGGLEAHFYLNAGSRRLFVLSEFLSSKSIFNVHRCQVKNDVAYTFILTISDSAVQILVGIFFSAQSLDVL